MRKGNLVIYIKESEKIIIGDVEFKILSSNKAGARVLVTAPKDIKISEKIRDEENEKNYNK